MAKAMEKKENNVVNTGAFSYKQARRGKMDFWIFITIAILLAIGTIMVFSSSAAYAYSKFGDTYYFLKRQLIFLILGFIAMMITANFDYRKYAKLSPWMIGVTLFLLILTALVGFELNGAKRWLGTSSFSFQPSEILKITLILFLAYIMSKNYRKMGTFLLGFILPIAITGSFALILYFQPHMSCALIIVAVTAIMMVLAGTKLRYFFAAVGAVVPILVYIVMTKEYILTRFLTFLDPFADTSDSGYQVIQSLYAIGSGGLFGRGIGRSLQKYLYLPEPYNDFILSILAEELGFVGVAAVIFLFGLLIWRGFRVANNAPDRFGSLVAAGITSLIAVQVVINIAVVTSSMPVTGMPLPFFSYGGTSLVFLMADMGILLNISRYATYEKF